MSQQTLREVRDSLLQMNTIQHEREFCERWLCKSECEICPKVGDGPHQAAF